jgi:MFS superfamily sulfate permease-like transporter
VDYTAARTVQELCKELVEHGIVLGLARVSPSLRADLDRHLLTEVIGPARLFDRLHDALAAFAKFKDPQTRTLS